MTFKQELGIALVVWAAIGALVFAVASSPAFCAGKW